MALNHNVGAAAPGLVTPDSGAQAKSFSTLQAQLALAGYQLMKDGRGGFTMASWGRHRDLDSLTAIVAFARQERML